MERVDIALLRGVCQTPAYAAAEREDDCKAPPDDQRRRLVADLLAPERQRASGRSVA